MTQGDGLFGYLSASLPVGDRVYPLTLPQGAVPPAVTSQLGGGEERAVKRAPGPSPRRGP